MTALAMQAHQVCSSTGNNKTLTSACMRIPSELFNQERKQIMIMSKIKNNSAHSHHNVRQPEPKTRRGGENPLIREHSVFTTTRQVALAK